MSIYLSYNEDELAGFASMGLLRRAKKGLEGVQMTSAWGDEPLVLVTEEETVQLPKTGIQLAKCTCGAHECCKHILTAVLWVQANMPSAETTAPDTTLDDASPPKQTTHTPSHAAAPQITALEELLGLESIKLQKSVRKNERLLAYQLVRSWLEGDGDASCHIVAEPTKVRFNTTLGVVTYFLGAGFLGMLSEIDKSKQAVHLACVAYAFLSEAQTASRWQWADDVSAWMDEQVADDELSAFDMTLIDEISAVCTSFVRQGLSHVDAASVLALQLFNMQARTQGLVRLAALVRDLQGVFRRFLQGGQVHIDERVIFVRLARLYGYLYALKHANQEHLPALKGVVRRQYNQGEQVSLIPVGGEWWSTSGGAHGLSLCFYDTQAGCLHEVTNARANTLDTTFNQHSAYSTGIWGASVETLSSHVLTLTEIKYSDTGRLSSGVDTRFVQEQALKAMSLAQFDEQVKAIDDWQHLYSLLRPTSILSHEIPRYVFVRFESYSPLTLNELAQRFECQLFDKNNAPLTVSLSIGTMHHPRIKKLEHWIHMTKMAGMLLRVQQDDSQVQQAIQLIPCSVLLDHKDKGVALFYLDYDYVPAPKKKTLLELMTGRIEKLLQKKHAQVEEAYSPMWQVIMQSQQMLEFYANTGRSAFDKDDEGRLDQLIGQLEQLGLYLYADALKASKEDFASYLLKARLALYVMQQVG